MKRQGFTLIELLIVIGIVGLLVAIVVPVLGRAKDSARAVLCGSNLRGLQTAMTQFFADNSYRPGGGLANSWVTEAEWGVWWNEPGNHDHGQVNIAGRGKPGDSDYAPSGDIWQYVQEPALYVCPTAEYKASDPPRGAQVWPGKAYGEGYSIVGGHIVPPIDWSRFEVARSYAMNDFLGDNVDEDDDPATEEVRVVVNYEVYGNARAIWLAEVHPWRDLSRSSGGMARSHIGPNETPGHFHSGEANCSFGDGHVERLSPAETLANLEPEAP